MPQCYSNVKGWLVKFVEIKMIITSINHLMNSFRKNNPSEERINLINPFIKNQIRFMHKTVIWLYLCFNKHIRKKQNMFHAQN
jgi:hypothetical protein